MKTVLSISEVFSLINTKTEKNSHVVLPTGQSVRISTSLIRLSRKPDLTCEECGCTGTHLQLYQQPGYRGEMVDIWRVMAWNKRTERPTFLNLDHIIPACMGGTFADKNTRVTCEVCNTVRGNRLLADHPLTKQLQGEIPLDKTVHLNTVINFVKERFVNIKNVVARLQCFEGICKRQVRKLGMSYKKVTVAECIKIMKMGLKQVGLNPAPDFYNAFKALIILN
jgi:hypothetical protein